MANPNIVSVTSIYGKTTGSNLTSNSMTTLLNNGASSSKVLKIPILPQNSLSKGLILFQ